MNNHDLAAYLDATLLKPESTRHDVERLIAEASSFSCYAVCVSPSMLPVQTPPGLKVATVIGFPSGSHASNVKAFEAGQAVAAGAQELDMVINLGAALNGDFAAVEADISAVRQAAPAPTVLKVIIESAVLDDQTIVEVCRAAMRAGADFVKTSTGFHPAGGATVHAVKLMAQTVAGKLGVKASGGIRDRSSALEMIAAGATRLGVSAAVAILGGSEEAGDLEVSY